MESASINMVFLAVSKMFFFLFNRWVFLKKKYYIYSINAIYAIPDAKVIYLISKNYFGIDIAKIFKNRLIQG